MVWDLHSEHSQTAGQESAASEEPLTGRMMSVSSAHVIICMLDLRRVAAKYPPNESASPPDRSFWWPQQAVCVAGIIKEPKISDVCLEGKVKVYPQVDAEDLQLHFAAQGRRSVWRWGCCRTDICSPVVGVEVVSNLRRGWILELFKKIIMSFWHGSLLCIIHSISHSTNFSQVFISVYYCTLLLFFT